jgi:CBS domain-containing protein/gamma-glutamylcysteine synthetase
MRHLLIDLRALSLMIEEGMIESDVRRIGAEQELFLVDRNWHPASVAMDLLGKIDDPHYTTELGLFNLEINLDPCTFGAGCLTAMEEELNSRLDFLRRLAAEQEVEVVLTGILPTLRKSDLGLENMTPMPRYRALDRALKEMRGGAYEFHIKGLDELLVKHDSVMVEACNASFQVHFQVGPAEFPNLYNVAQVVAAPVIAAATNSPLLFGRQLWRETRIALFQQAVDTRRSIHHLRDRSPRVSFGRQWIRDSVLELFQEDIARFRALMVADVEEDSMAVLKRGGTPELKALRLHNSTVYRWNRACYGWTDGKPHLRIENRVLPAGPTVLDQVANAAFWFGLISDLSVKHSDITKVIEFEDAKMNFFSAARLGLGAELTWLNGETLPSTTLICDRLVPLAEQGLKRSGLPDKEIERYLGVIHARVASHHTGAQWMVQSLAMMRDQGTPSERLNAVTAATIARQKTKRPVHEWEPARLEEAGGWKRNFLKVEQYMSTDLFTVQEDEPLDLVAGLMDWEHIRHVPVEDQKHRLIGLVSYRALLRLLARGGLTGEGIKGAVADVMLKTLVTIDPEASTLEAIGKMRKHRIGCLPVVKDGKLVGIITERDFMNVSAELLEQKLKEN